MPRSIASLALLIVMMATACDPLQGSGTGNQPDPSRFIKVDSVARTAVVTLIAGYPATDSQFNYDGYAYGALTLTVPAGWQMTVQCENHGTVPNSCAVVADAKATAPLDSAWSTPDPHTGLAPGESATFVFTPQQPGRYRIASLVAGAEASGTWADLEVVAAGTPKLAGS